MLQGGNVLQGKICYSITGVKWGQMLQSNVTGGNMLEFNLTEGKMLQ